MRHSPRTLAPPARRLVPILVVLLAACSAGMQVGSEPSTVSAADAATARAEIAAMLERAAGAWNRGDLDAFMEDFADAPGTTFIGRSGVVRGREAIRAVYASRFAPGATRDSLRFEQLEVDLLAPGVANAIAWYVLHRGDSTVARGPTSLVLRRGDGRWRIVHDHSS